MGRLGDTPLLLVFDKRLFPFASSLPSRATQWTNLHLKFCWLAYNATPLAFKGCLIGLNLDVVDEVHAVCFGGPGRGQPQVECASGGGV